jgi:hypothetical protein
MKFLVTGVSMFNNFIATFTKHDRPLYLQINIVIKHLLTKTVI